MVIFSMAFYGNWFASTCLLWRESISLLPGEQLLKLQQILFFCELGFPLNEIRQILSSDDFNKIESLKAHKYMLESGLKRM